MNCAKMEEENNVIPIFNKILLMFFLARFRVSFLCSIVLLKRESVPLRPEEKF